MSLKSEAELKEQLKNMNGPVAFLVMFFVGLYTLIFLMPILKSGGAWSPLFGVAVGILAIDSLLGGRIAKWLGFGEMAIDYIYFMNSIAMVSGLVFTIKLEGAAFAVMGALYFGYFTLTAARLLLKIIALNVGDWKEHWSSFRLWVKICDLYVLLFVVGVRLFF